MRRARGSRGGRGWGRQEGVGAPAKRTARTRGWAQPGSGWGRGGRNLLGIGGAPGLPNALGGSLRGESGERGGPGGGPPATVGREGAAGGRGGCSRVGVERVAHGGWPLARRGRALEVAAGHVPCRCPRRAAGPGRRAGEGQRSGGVDGGRGWRFPLSPIYTDLRGQNETGLEKLDVRTRGLAVSLQFSSSVGYACDEECIRGTWSSPQALKRPSPQPPPRGHPALGAGSGAFGGREFGVVVGRC